MAKTISITMPTPAPRQSALHGANYLVSHADRCWKAEEVNATRIATRANWVLSVLTAVIGLKLFAIGKEISVVVGAGWGAPAAVFWSAAGISLVLLFVSLVLVLGVVRTSGSRKGLPKLGSPPRSASSALELDPLLVRNPWEPDEADVAWYVFKVTYNAAMDLRARNTQRAAAIDNAQLLLLAAILLLFVSIIVYAWLVYGQGTVGV